LTNEAFAVAITDTHAYVAYSIGHIDRDFSYEAVYVEEFGERCSRSAGQDRSSSELVLARIAFADGSLETLLSLPTESLGWDHVADHRTDTGPVAISIDAGQVALSVRSSPGDGSARVRVLHVGLE
jgi:hypothetical protein